MAENTEKEIESQTQTNGSDMYSKPINKPAHEIMVLTT